MRVGLIGAKLQGLRRAPTIQSFPGTELVVINAAHKESAQALANKFGCEVTVGWETVVKRSDLDAVVVCTPPHLRAQISIAAMESGKHVLCEKPLARTLQEAEAMVKTAEANGVKLKCLITGCNGFVGSYLAEFLINRGVIVYGTIYRGRERVAHLGDKITTFECEILDKEKVESVVSQVKPDVVFHLAAQSRVAPSWQDPEETFKVNILGTLYLLEALRKVATDPVVVVVCSAAEYGYCGEDEPPIKEDRELRPSDPYAVSKVSQDLFARLYWETYSLKVIRVRPFNITGPGMTGDACSDFARGIVEIERGQRAALNVGDLGSGRDITDVRDAVEALWLLSERGALGQVYNLGSSVGYRIGDLLDKLIRMSNRTVRVLQDNTKIRGSGERAQIGDNKKLCKLGWRLLIPIEKTLSDMLDYRRKTLDLKKISLVLDK